MTRDELIDELLRRERGWSAIRSATGWTSAVQGPVVLIGRTGRSYRFHVRIDLPKRFPVRTEHPDVWVLESPFAFHEDAHIDDLGNLCLELPQAHQLEYEQIGLVGFFDHMVFHLDRLRIHALTGKFPGPEYAHGADGVRQFLREKQAELGADLPLALRSAMLPWVPIPPDRQHCPCGSGLRFGACHRSRLMQARRTLASFGPFPRRELIRTFRSPFRRRTTRG